jgi:hypothetical protein
MNEMLTRQNTHLFFNFSYLVLDDYAGRITRELWWTIQEFSPAGIISQRLFMLLYHMGDEQ